MPSDRRGLSRKPLLTNGDVPAMPYWVPTTIILAYTGIVLLLALAGAFSETVARRDAAYKVLRVMLPWGLVTAAAHIAVNQFGPGA